MAEIGCQNKVDRDQILISIKTSVHWSVKKYLNVVVVS